MEPAYYLPHISELHVGLEVEVKIRIDIDDGEWEKHTIKPTGLPGFTELYAALEDGFLRVKFFDTDDIIAGGWEKTLTTGMFTKGGCAVKYIPPEELKSIIPWVIIYDTNDLVFRGHIRNRSEFEMIVDRLNLFPAKP